MSNFIDARVIQKTGSEAEWLANDLILYKGELALVTQGDRVINIKVGNGTKKFSELPYIYNGGFEDSVTPTTQGSTLVDGMYIANGAGTYANMGGLIVKEGYFTIISKVGNTYKIASEVKMPEADLTPLNNKIIANTNAIKTKVSQSNIEGSLVQENNDIQIQTNASEYGMIKTKVYTDGSNEFIFDLNHSVFDKQFAFSTDKISNARQHNSVKEIALNGKWKGKDLRAFQIDKTATANEYRIIIGEFTSETVYKALASGTAIWDTTSKYLKINLTQLNSSGISGYVILNPKIKGQYNFNNYTYAGAVKIVNVIDLTDYIVNDNAVPYVNVSDVAGYAVKAQNGFAIQANTAEYGLIKTKSNTTEGTDEFVFDLSKSIFDRTKSMHSNGVANTRLHNSVISLSIKGKFRDKELRLFSLRRKSDGNYEVFIGYFASESATSKILLNGLGTWDGVSKILVIKLEPSNASGLSGEIVINPRILGTYAYSNYTYVDAIKIVTIEDINNYMLDDGTTYNSIKASGNNEEVIKTGRDLVVQTSDDNFGLIRGRKHRVDNSEFIYDLNDSILEPNKVLHTDAFVNQRFHNVLKSLSLRGDYKKFDIRFIQAFCNTSTKIITFVLANYNSSANTLSYIANGTAVWDTTSKYLTIPLTSVNNSDISGYAIIRPKMLYPYNYGSSPIWAEDFNLSPRVLEIQDLNDYSNSTPTPTPESGGINEVSRVADAQFGLNKIGNILFNKKRDNTVEVVGERLQNEKVRIHTIKNSNANADFFRDGYWYCSHGQKITRTKDFETYEDVTGFFDRPIVKIYPLNNGNILACLSHSTTEASLAQSGLWLVEPDGSKRQVKQYTYVGVSAQANWNLSVRDNVVTWGEYGRLDWTNWTENPSRFIYASFDYGETWQVIFDKNEHADLFENKDKAHIHGCCYDPYWKRFWFHTGDTVGNQILAWSDDNGATWKRELMTGYNNGEMGNIQFLTMYATRDAVILGSDVFPNAIFRIVKREKSDIPVVERMHLFEGDTGLTRMPKYMTQISDGLVIIPIGKGDGINSETPEDELKYRIFATYNGITYREIWKNDFTRDLLNENDRLSVSVNNNREIVISVTDTRFENRNSLYIGQIENM